jgi:hypothetical protein
MKLIGRYRIPVYAVCAIEYGDYSGLDDEDEKAVKKFLDDEFPHGYVVQWQDSSYFSSSPAFGPATDVCDADFYEP